MQQQQIRQHQETTAATSSLTAVKTLVKAGLGCIAYIRSLLPDDASDVNYLAAEGPDGRSQSSQKDSVKIRMLKRGYSTEVDNLLDYVELGIFHALERNYLRSFVFAIYLDKEDPNNLVEAYTFNFAYHSPNGTGAGLPVMTLDSQLENLSLAKNKDPLASAIMKGKSPTIGDVKASVKNLLKRIIANTDALAELPRRRFATFKLYYHPDTPDDYEPPLFVAGDPNKDRFYFTTHYETEVPEKVLFGSMESPYHSVGVEVTSISNHIPPREADGSIFADVHMSDNILPGQPRSESEMAMTLERETNQQIQDALERNVVWAADSEVHISHKEPQQVDPLGPIGVRTREGDVRLFSESHVKAQGTFIGDVSQVIDDLGLQLLNDMERSPFDETQRITYSPPPYGPVDRASSMTIDGVPFSEPPTILASNFRDRPGSTNLPNGQGPSGSQPRAQGDVMDIDSPGLSQPSRIGHQASGYGGVRPRGNPLAQEESGALQCICDDPEQDGGSIWCDGGCGKGFHIWCMGYQSCEDPRLPEEFECFSCHLGNPKYGLLTKEEKMFSLAGYKELALTRRALKVVMEEEAPENPTRFAKRLGCETAVAQQLIKKLTNEGFLANEYTVTDELGIIETRTTAPGTRQTKQKQAKRSRPKKGKLVTIKTGGTRAAMTLYFQPGGSLELGLIVKKKMLTAPMRAARPHPSARNNVQPSKQRLPLSDLNNVTPSSSSIVLPKAASTTVVPHARANQEAESAAVAAPLKRKIIADEPNSNQEQHPVTLKRIKLSMAAKPMDLEEEDF